MVSTPDNSTAHAGTVSLVLNPKTGHVSPQFHIIVDDLFTTVPFMQKNQLPPNLADLDENSQELVTDERFNLAKTWLFLLDDAGDNASIPEPNPILQQDEKGVIFEPIAKSIATDDTVTFEPIANSIASTASSPIDFLADNPARLPVCEGDVEHSSNKDFEPPKMINLENSGLRRS